MQNITAKGMTILMHNGWIVKVFVPQSKDIDLNQVVTGDIVLLPDATVTGVKI